jgi:hypothetical protein
MAEDVTFEEILQEILRKNYTKICLFVPPDSDILPTYSDTQWRMENFAVPLSLNGMITSVFIKCDYHAFESLDQ